MDQIADLIARALAHVGEPAALAKVAEETTRALPAVPALSP